MLFVTKSKVFLMSVGNGAYEIRALKNQILYLQYEGIVAFFNLHGDVSDELVSPYC